MKRLSVVVTGLLTFGSLAGGALAAGPTQADVDSCNQKAAQATKTTPGQSGASTQPAAPPPTGMQTETNKPGTPASPGGAAQSAPSGNNPTGGRITDSSAPGMPPSAVGMAKDGETDPVYRQAYLACLKEKE